MCGLKMKVRASTLLPGRPSTVPSVWVTASEPATGMTTAAAMIVSLVGRRYRVGPANQEGPRRQRGPQVKGLRVKDRSPWRDWKAAGGGGAGKPRDRDRDRGRHTGCQLGCRWIGGDQAGGRGGTRAWTVPWELRWGRRASRGGIRGLGVRGSWAGEKDLLCGCTSSLEMGTSGSAGVGCVFLKHPRAAGSRHRLGSAQRCWLSQRGIC